MPREKQWFDEAAGPLVRPYTVTRGRTRVDHNLEMTTLVVAVQPVTRGLAATLDPEHVKILLHCLHSTSVAEIAARMELPLSVASILISDLIERRLVTSQAPVTPTVAVLRAVFYGLRQL